MLQKIRSGLVQCGMCLEQQNLHAIGVASREALITLQELLYLRLVIFPKSIVPDIVLSQTDVDVKGDVVLCALQ